MRKFAFVFILICTAFLVRAQDAPDDVPVLELTGKVVYISADDELLWVREGTNLSPTGEVILDKSGALKLLNGIEVVELRGPGRFLLKEHLAPEPPRFMMGFGGDFLAMVSEVVHATDDPPATTGSGKKGMGDDDPPAPTGSGKKGMGDDDPPPPTSKVKKGMGDDDPPPPTSKVKKGMGDDDPPPPTAPTKKGMGDDDPPPPTSTVKKGMGDDDPPAPTGTGKKGMGAENTAPSGAYPVWGKIAPGIVYFTWPAQEDVATYRLTIYQNKETKPFLEVEVTGSFHEMDLSQTKGFKPGNTYYWDVAIAEDPERPISGTSFQYMSAKEEADALTVLEGQAEYDAAGEIQKRLWEAYAYEEEGFKYKANAIYKELRQKYPDNVLIWKMYNAFLAR